MGNSSSSSSSFTKEDAVFTKDLQSINDIVNSIITNQNIFHDNNFNFLSENVCNKYYLLLSEELDKHLKVDLQSLGSSLYLIPKDDDKKIEKFNLNKQQLCQKISNHYIKILYVLCLIKYVFDLERDGKNNIFSIMNSNVKINDDVLEIHFCNTPHSIYTKDEKRKHKIDFGIVAGIHFFTNYFLEKDDAIAFMTIIRSILARKNNKDIFNQFCQMSKTRSLSESEFKELENVYKQRIQCQSGGSESDIDLNVFIEKNNPFFSTTLCSSHISFEYKPIEILISSKRGKKIYELYKTMRSNYEKNIKNIEKLILLLVQPSTNHKWTLKDVTKPILDKTIESIKVMIKIFYIQSIVDFHTLLDNAKEKI